MSTISSTSVLSFLTWSRLATVTIGTYWSLSIWEMRYMSLARFSLRTVKRDTLETPLQREDKRARRQHFTAMVKSRLGKSSQEVKVQAKPVQPVAQGDQPGVDNAERLVFVFHHEEPLVQHMILFHCKGVLIRRPATMRQTLLPALALCIIALDRVNILLVRCYLLDRIPEFDTGQCPGSYSSVPKRRPF